MVSKNIFISTNRIDDRIRDLGKQLTSAMKREPEKRREMVKKQIIGRIKELGRLKAYITGGLEKW